MYFVVLPASDYNAAHLFFAPTVKNTILEKGLFTRILYSSHYFTTNGVYLKDFTRQTLKQLETDVLTAFRTPKTKCITLSVLPQSCWAGKTLAVSGIWETETSVGLAFKFVRLPTEAQPLVTK
jgi:hypothetical protein